MTAAVVTEAVGLLASICVISESSFSARDSTYSSVSVTTAAVITALGYLDELKKSTSGADNMRAQIKDYLEDAAKAKLAAEEARREVERLRREIGYLKEKK